MLIIPFVIGLWIFIPDGILGHPMSDMADHFWGNRWFAQQLSQGRLPIHTQSTHFPEGGYHWHIDPIGGCLQLLTLWLPPHDAWHIGLFLQLSAMGIVMALYAHHKLRRLELSIGLGLALVFSAHVLGLLHSGLSEYLGIGWLIGLMWTLDRHRSKQAGLLLGLCFWQAAPYGLLGALLVCHRTWRQPLQLLTIALISAVIASPAIIAIQWTANHPEAAFQMTEAAGWSPQSLPSVDVFGWWMPGNWLHPNTPAFGNPGILQAHSLSLTLVAILIWGLWNNAELRQKGFAQWPIAILMLGPKLSLNRWMPLGGLFFLPMALLYLPGLPTQAFHHPYHIAAIVLPMALIAAGQVLKNAPAWLQLILFITYVLESTISPAGLFPARTPVPSSIDINGAVMDWPPDRHMPNRMYLLAHSYHQQPTYSGVSQWLSPCLLHSHEIKAALKELDDPRFRSLNRDQHHPIEIPAQTSHSWASCGFEHLLVHKSYLNPRELEASREFFNSKLALPIFENEEIIHYQMTNMTVE